MKNWLAPQQLILFTGLFLCMALSCKKTETVTINLQQPSANFLLTSNTAAIDSNFYFRNTSDSGALITYSWDFGDGTSSADKNPKHSYFRRGNYNVTLKVSNDNRVSGTVQQTISVVLGQQHISFGEMFNMAPVAIEETSGNDFILLGSTGYGSTFFLMQLDSLLKQKTRKDFPATYNLSSMQSTADGNYIFTGSTQSATKSNELIKMKADGTLLWNKILSPGDSYSFATQTADGGYAVVGNRQVGADYYTIVVRADNNGNPLGQKQLDQEGLMGTNNTVIEQDGIVLAGRKRGPCQECDSIMIVKLDNNNGIALTNTVFGGLNNFNWADCRISKLTNGNYAVTNAAVRGIFFFSASGGFVDRRLAVNQVSGLVSAGDGSIVTLQNEYGNGNRMVAIKQTLDGSQQWLAYTDGKQYLPSGGYSCCSSSWPTVIKNLRKGGTFISGYRVDNNTINGSIHTVIVLLELDDAGKPK